MDLVIVDDEPLARDRLTRLVTALGHEVLGTAKNADGALEIIDRLDPTVVLLDIEMPGGTGLDVAKKVDQLENPPAIIFTTAYEEHALAAFDTPAVGYLLKPIKRDHIAQALEKAQVVNKAQLNTLQDHKQTEQQEIEEEQHVTVRSHRGIDLIPIDSIRCFLADSKYITLINNQNEYLMDGTLKKLEERFPKGFIRVHRNALVAIAYVEGLYRSAEGVYSVRLNGIEQQPIVSRRYASKVKSLLERL